jgi:hypothetical protein
MDARKQKLISWKNGYDIHDIQNREYRVIVARKIRKQEKAQFRKEVLNYYVQDCGSV